MTRKRTERHEVMTALGMWTLRATHEGDRWLILSETAGTPLGWIKPVKLDGRPGWKVYHRPRRIGAVAECVAYDRTRKGAVMALARHEADRLDRLAQR